MHDELTAEVGLGQTGGVEVQEVEHIELAGAEVPPLKEDAAGVPDGVGGAQQLHQGPVARVVLAPFRSHIDCLLYYC